MEYKYSIDALIEALQIYKKYCNDSFPTTCEHDMLFLNKMCPDDVSHEDLMRLDELGFEPYEDFAFVSYRFGSN